MVENEGFVSSEWQGGEPHLPNDLKWIKNGSKYLGVDLGVQVKVNKNWEGGLKEYNEN